MWRPLRLKMRPPVCRAPAPLINKPANLPTFQPKIERPTSVQPSGHTSSILSLLENKPRLPSVSPHDDMGVDPVEKEWGELRTGREHAAVKKIRKQLREERYEEQQLGLDIWTWSRDQLIALSVDLAYRVGIHRILNIPLDNYISYCGALADQYLPTNTYHNFTHATDVLLVLCHLLLECGGATRMSEWEIAACFLAAHAHDVGHPGTNNRYQVAAKTALGVKYGADATLEAYSADLGQQLLDEYNLLSNISSQDRLLVLTTFRSSILGTDMARHHTTCQALRHLPDDFYSQNYPPKRPGRPTIGDCTHALSLPALLLHAADISGPSRQSVRIWLTRSLAVTREFVHQGDCERKNHLPVTEAFDRLVLQSEGLEGFQRRENEFTRGLVLPYFRDVERVWSGIKPLRLAIEDNLGGWGMLDRKIMSKLWKGIFV